MALSDRLVDVTRDAWRRVRVEITEHIRRLWAEADLPLMETRATESLSAWLEGHGFTVERGACGIPTAFAATFGRGEGPTVALLAEYDALPGPCRIRRPTGSARVMPAATTRSARPRSARPSRRGLRWRRAGS